MRRFHKRRRIGTAYEFLQRMFCYYAESVIAAGIGYKAKPLFGA